ncbi:Retrovirus-related Pol polyprotein from transposon TNT 1-94 [Gossypium australe]|uniref:Retrovirus-related Pol polyprotein from transposon TNT 1-94 n=1 Tax=Gossypium australe TaxID=47621 RepID=A0A5B6WJ58_9ROSI|nr:Retrovirus-related Pol polyprotein from transposon TNT 1-94 [Gossypium australe]
MYAMICTRLDIAHVVGMQLRTTSKRCLCFGKGKPELSGYSNADMARNVDLRKSTSKYVAIFLGGVVSWQSKLQKCVALSTTKAKYIAATEACKEMLWMKFFC